MNILENIYSKSVSENEKNLRFWEDYLNNLKSLNFKQYGEKLTVPILVPIGSRVLFRGELKHTNELTVAMGADYFTKCSIPQAEILRQHRIKDAQSKVDIYRKEKDYLENQFIFRKQNILDTAGQEIVEEYTEDQEKEWRKKHRENVRQYKTQSKDKEEKKEEATDEELWNRLEELELQEELENELLSMGKEVDVRENVKSQNTFLVEEEEIVNSVKTETSKEVTGHKEILDPKEKVTDHEPISKLELLQKVIDRQNELEEKLQELKCKERSRSKTENDLISRLDEMEQLDELEDEMDRLDDIIEDEDVDSEEDSDTIKIPAPSIKRSVSFAAEDDSETLEITFKHSDVSPSNEPYDPDEGILKPSDIYSAHGNLFSSEKTSILKKAKKREILSSQTVQPPAKSVTFMQTDEDDEPQNANKTIVVRDVVERSDQNGNMVENPGARPTSLFKKKRMQKK